MKFFVAGARDTSTRSSRSFLSYHPLRSRSFECRNHSKGSIGLLFAILVYFLSLAGVASAVDPSNKPDRSFITINGTVASTESSKGLGFTLDYGNGLIAVEVDDWDWEDKSVAIIPGERVTVTGRIDKDLFERRSIEASSVYVINRNTFYFGSSVDEEGPNQSYFPDYNPTYPADGSWLTVTGIVKSKNPTARSFDIDTGVKRFEVKTFSLGYNPLDEIGLQRIQKGDRVSVTGRLDNDFFEKDDIIATSVVTLVKGVRKKRS